MKILFHFSTSRAPRHRVIRSCNLRPRLRSQTSSDFTPLNRCGCRRRIWFVGGRAQMYLRIEIKVSKVPLNTISRGFATNGKGEGQMIPHFHESMPRLIFAIITTKKSELVFTAYVYPTDEIVRVIRPLHQTAYTPKIRPTARPFATFGCGIRRQMVKGSKNRSKFTRVSAARKQK